LVQAFLKKWWVESDFKVTCATAYFKRAFDSVSHVGLSYKLKKTGVGDIIKNMYYNTEVYVKSGNSRSDFFQSIRGN
jgi:hypothetical protein